MSKRDRSNIENVEEFSAGPSLKKARVANASGGSLSATVSNYERARMQRINENQALLGELNMALPRFKANPATQKPRARPAPDDSAADDDADKECQPGEGRFQLRPSKKPKRRSARIADADKKRLAPSGAASAPDEELHRPALRRSRRVSGLTSPSKVYAGANYKDKVDEYDDAKSSSDEDNEPERGRLDLTSELSDLLDQMKPFDNRGSKASTKNSGGFSPNNLTFQCCVRPLHKRVFSMALRDDGTAQQPLLGAAGDTMGNVGLFVCADESDAALTGRLHTDRVTDLTFGCGGASHLLFSSSYDGLVRFVDLNACAGDEISDELRKARIGATALACMPAVASVGEALAVGGEDGQIRILDRRTGNTCELTVNCGRRVVKCIDPHPGPGRVELCLSASLDGNVHLWDLRSPRRPLNTFEQGRCADSAYWNPVGDMRFLTTSLNDTVRIYDAANTGAEPLVSINHDNYTTRYLSNFRAIWCPSSGGGDGGPIAVGSMHREPRRIELYSPETGRLIDSIWDPNMTTVTSLVRWQASRGVMCGGNSCGKVFVFGQATDASAAAAADEEEN